VTEHDSIDNQRLIANGLQHMAYELSLPDPSYFRIAREAHRVLYRSMTETLKGTANLTITGRLPRTVRYQAGRSPWREICREEPPTGRRAWRFSASALVLPLEPADLMEEVAGADSAQVERDRLDLDAALVGVEDEDPARLATIAGATAFLDVDAVEQFLRLPGSLTARPDP
jgi:hypothetical protein